MMKFVVLTVMAASSLIASTVSPLLVLPAVAEGWVATTTTTTATTTTRPKAPFTLATTRRAVQQARGGASSSSSSWTTTTTTTTTVLNVASSSSSSTSSVTTSSMPRLSSEHLQQLQDQKYVVIPDFLSTEQQEALRRDVLELRNSHHKFKIAKIGQDATNELNTQIRVAETCFIGSEKGPDDLPDTSGVQTRNELYSILDQVRSDLQQSSSQRTLDASLTELLYAYYPQGGYYRRHTDAVAQSASVLRSISLLLYLNDADWDTAKDGGALRIHLDSGGDFLPANEEPNFVDVEPKGGTLVLLESDAIPHEVLDTNRERMAVVGWYNRPMGLSDMVDLAQGASGVGVGVSGGAGGGSSEMKTIMLGVAAALVTVGVIQILT